MKTEEENLLELIEASSSELQDMIEEYVKDKDRKKALYAMFDEDISMLYLIAPASSKTEYHNSFYGGLYEHSFNVFENLTKLNKTFSLGFSQETMFVVSLLHDFGKAVTPDLKSPHYKDSEAWKKTKLGQGFEPDYSSGYFTNRDRTMFVLQHFGVKLSPQEYQAILLNDGYMVDANRAYAMKEYELSFWLQVADEAAARKEKDGK